MSDASLEEMQKEWHGSKRAYHIGFGLSLFLTAVAYFLVWSKAFTPTGLVYIIFALALVQAVVQVLFFLHVGEESRPHWQTGFFLFMILILAMIVLGTLWIMKDLDNRMMIEMTTQSSHKEQLK